MSYPARDPASAGIDGKARAASLNLLYALVGAQERRHCREIARERRTELLLRLDDLGKAP